MRVKITQRGWEKYNGPLYATPFENGVSQGELTRQQALQLGAMLPIVEIDEEGNELGPVSPTVDLLQARTVSAEVVVPMETDAAAAAAIEPEVTEGTEPKEGEGAKSEEGPNVYTQAELEEIASTKGIAGLREIGDPLGVKNTAIRGLIREILAAQNGQ